MKSKQKLGKIGKNSIKPKHRKLAIVCSGGGMTCSYSAGFLSAIAKEYGYTNPDIVIAGSGSAGSASCFVSGQYEIMTDIWAHRLSNKHFLNIYRFWKIMDIDYLIDEVLKNHINIDAVNSSKIDFYIPITNSKTGKVSYVSNRDNHDMFEAMRATKALPVFYGKTVPIGADGYIDSPLSSRVETSIPKAIELGATDIIAVASNNPSSFNDIVYRLWMLTKPEKFKKNYNLISNKIKNADYTDKANIVIVRPKTKLKIRAVNNSQKLLQKAIKQGYDECKNSKDIKTMLNAEQKA